MKHLVRLFLMMVGVALLTGSALAQTEKKTTSIKIEGNYLEYTTTNRVTIITGKPVMVKDMESGLQLNCETLRVNWATNNSGIDKAFADGTVVIMVTEKDGAVRKATGEQAVYDGKTDVITLTGNPAVNDTKGFSMQGSEKIIYERASSKFSAVGGKISGNVEMDKVDLKKAVTPEQKK